MTVTVTEGPRGRFLRWVGWSGRSDVERVQRYTDWSLRSMVWIFLLFYGAVVVQDAGSPPRAVVTGVLLLALGYVGGQAARVALGHWPQHGVPRGRWELYLLTVVLVLATGWGYVVAVPGQAGYPMALAMVIAWGWGGFRSRAATWGAVLGSAAVGWLLGQDVVLAAVVAGFAVFMVFALQSSLWFLGVVHELDRARTVQAELAVAQERLRFAGDVHDVMGRHLSVIAVQAELAAASVAKRDERAGERIAQVRSSAHDALREARELARGYRPLDLAQELDGAVSLLASAGVRAEVDVRAVAGGVPSVHHDAVARVVREAITNVIRHSDARRVQITWTAGALTIANDCPRTGNGDAHSSGLASLTAGAERLGGTLVHGVVPGADGEEFVLTLTLPV